MLRKLSILVFALGGVSACSSPGADPPTSAAATVPAPMAAAYITPATPGSSRATTCSVAGMRWKYWDSQINPTMIVSNDGFCGTHVSVSANTPVLAHVASAPAHGRVDTSGEGTTEARIRYYPDQGYVGSDTFAVVTGTARHEVVADFSVKVSS